MAELKCPMCGQSRLRYVGKVEFHASLSLSDDSGTPEEWLEEELVEEVSEAFHTNIEGSGFDNIFFEEPEVVCDNKDCRSRFNAEMFFETLNKD